MQAAGRASKATPPSTRQATKRTMSYTGRVVQRDETAADDDGGGEFLPVKTKRRRRHSQRKMQHQQSTASNNMIDDAIDAVLSQGARLPDSDSDMSLSDLSDLPEEGTRALKAELNRLTNIVTTLQHRVDFLLSYVGITQSQIPSRSTSNDNAPAANTGSNDSPSASSQPTTIKSYASAAAHGIQKLQGPMKNVILTPMYSDLRARESMQNNVVIYGLPSKAEQTDLDVVVELSIVNFGYKPDVARVTRLGKPAPNKIQPLLVVCNGDDGKLLLSMAKRLRNCNDEYIRKSVFISPQLTRAERQAAYESRCRRRQQHAAVAGRPTPNGGPKKASSTDAPATASTMAPSTVASSSSAFVEKTQASSVVVNAIRSITTTSSSAAVISRPTVGQPSRVQLCTTDKGQAQATKTVAAAVADTPSHASADHNSQSSSAAADQQPVVNFQPQQLDVSAAEFAPFAAGLSPAAATAAGGGGGGSTVNNAH